MGKKKRREQRQNQDRDFRPTVIRTLALGKHR
jgi:hypothetical protein